MNRKLYGLYFLGASALAVGAFAAGCNTDNPLAGDASGIFLRSAAFACPDREGVVGKATLSISTGTSSIDALFGSGDPLPGRGRRHQRRHQQTELDGIAVSLGLPAGYAAAAAIKARKIANKISANVTGKMTVVADPPHCTVSAQATTRRERALRCVRHRPGSASVQVHGELRRPGGREGRLRRERDAHLHRPDPAQR